ncbi:MAG: RnfABCDGE type electron transport complex subunit G [Ruminiclostridium sp.]|nr:RnfABCDGE type electron transport complex subunit G [Ruminiclostridium sp.]
MRDMFKPALVLFVICLIVGAAMAFTNFATAGRIEQRITEDSENARKAVLPDADGFVKMNLDKIKAVSGNSGYDTIKEAYAAKKGDSVIGYVFLAKPAGYAGEINIMIGIDGRGHVSGVEIGDNKETPGLGSKAKDKKFKGQFSDKKYDIINVVKRKAEKGDEVQAISGATITSKAVSIGVQQASRLAGALLNNVNSPTS